MLESPWWFNNISLTTCLSGTFLTPAATSCSASCSCRMPSLCRKTAIRAKIAFPSRTHFSARSSRREAGKLLLFSQQLFKPPGSDWWAAVFKTDAYLCLPQFARGQNPTADGRAPWLSNGSKTLYHVLELGTMHLIMQTVHAESFFSVLQGIRRQTMVKCNGTLLPFSAKCSLRSPIMIAKMTVTCEITVCIVAREKLANNLNWPFGLMNPIQWSISARKRANFAQRQLLRLFYIQQRVEINT